MTTLSYELAKERDSRGKFLPGHGKTNTPEGIAKQSGSKHYLWKGNDASYFAKHGYMRTHYGKAIHCENPGGCVYPRKNRGRNTIIAPKRFEWALIKGRAYSHKREDYIMLCPSCHRKYDAN